MRVLFVHNEYAAPSGEERAFQALAQLLIDHGHEVGCYRRSSQEIAGSLVGNVKAFLTGIYNPCTLAAASRRLEEFQPDLVQVQNLYPLTSPSVSLARVRGALVFALGRATVSCPQPSRCRPAKWSGLFPEELLTFVWHGAWLSGRKSCLRRPPPD
jgi:hypothetical protein